MIREEARALVGVLIAAYPNANLEQATVDLYARHFETWDFSVGSEAIHDWVLESQWFPTIAELKAVYDRRASWISTGSLKELEEAKGPRELPPEVHALLERMAVKDMEPKRTVDGLKVVSGGKCDDCGKDAPERFLFHKLALCRLDAQARLRVQEQVSV
jgi:hypothetical protein